MEMIGGKTRWEVGKEQMGEEFRPYSICTGDDNTIYVADTGLHKIHLLSASDGTVIKQFEPARNMNIIAVKFHDQHLYVEHDQKPKYAISKFKI